MSWHREKELIDGLVHDPDVWVWLSRQQELEGLSETEDPASFGVTVRKAST